MKRAAIISLALTLLAGCGDFPSRSRVQTPEEAMGLNLPTPLAASVENWIEHTDLGEAWAQAKENVSDLRARLVADWNARQESQVGETEASRKLRKDYDRWLAIHDELKAFILDCHASNRLQGVPEGLAKYFKDWSALRRALLHDAPAELAAIDEALTALRTEFTALNASTESVEPRFKAMGALASRANSCAASAEVLQSNAGMIAGHFVKDEDVAALASRAADTAAEAKDFSAKVSAALAVVEGQKALSSFAEECRRMNEWIRSLDSRNAAKDARIAQEKEWRRRVILARKSGNRAEISSAANALSGFRAAMAQDKADGRLAQKDVKAFKQYIDAKTFRSFRQTLPDGARAGADTLIEGVRRSLPNDCKPESFFVALETKASKLHDDYEEKTAISELEAAIYR